jgi:hypothetical protein
MEVLFYCRMKLEFAEVGMLVKLMCAVDGHRAVELSKDT